MLSLVEETISTFGGSTGSGGSVAGSTASELATAYKGIQGKNLSQLASPLAASFVTSPVGPILAGLFAILGFAKGKTERMTEPEARRVADELAPGIYNRILATATPEQRAYLAEHLPGKVINFMPASNWWNERDPDHVRDSYNFYDMVKGVLPADNPRRIELSIWYLIYWAGKNSPKDQTDLQPHLQQIFAEVIGREMQQAYAIAPGELAQASTSPAQASVGQPSNLVVLLGTGAVLGVIGWLIRRAAS